MKETLKEELLQEAEVMQAQLTRWRRFLHAHAETGFDLPETVAFVTKELAAMGITANPCGRCGLVAELGRKEKETVFLLRADMDALPIPEESGVSFAAPTGKSHACGHDMHTAMLLGAAQLLKAREAEIQGTVRFMFQPAEELLSGAKDMIEAGVINDPPVTGAMMLHVMTGTALSAGTVIVAAPGVSAPAADYFTIEVFGKGCHGSSPNLGIDPVNAAAHVVLALQAIQTRELSIGERAALTIGSIQGGEAANVIPDKVILKGTLRAYSEETRVFLKKRLQEVAEQTAETFGATATVTFPCGCPALQNDESLSNKMLRYAKELLGEEKAFSAAELTKGREPGRGENTAGSEDFAYVSEKVPSVMVALSAGKGYEYPLHHPKVRFDEAALPVGSALLAYVALRETV
ncbi:MAG: amidohydrolase [Lachnospiraceae bacterium]|nr:amidohydrolase [Lachnospiraceae bacterium]